MNLLFKVLLYANLMHTIFYNTHLFKIYIFMLWFYIIVYIYLGKNPFNDFRTKIATASWESPNDPSSYLKFEIELDNIEKELKKFNEDNNCNISLTHIFIKILSNFFEKAPRLNGRIYFGRFIPFDGIHISTVVNVNGKNVSTVLVENVEKKNLIDIKNSWNPYIKEIKNEKRENTKKRTFLKLLPHWIIEILFEIKIFVSVVLNIDKKYLNINKIHLGVCGLSNISGFGIKDAFSSLSTKLYKICMTALLNDSELKPKIENGKIVIKKICNLNITVDHRLGDGSLGVHMIDSIKDMEKNIGEYLKESKKSLIN